MSITKSNLSFLALILLSLIAHTGFRNLPREQEKTPQPSQNPIANNLSVAAPAITSNTPQLEITTSSMALGLNDTVDVSVNLINLDQPISAFQFDLLFDESILQLITAEPDTYFAAASDEVICPQRALLANGVRLACIQSGTGSGSSLDGRLATFQLAGIANGQADISVSNIKLTDLNAPPSTLNVQADTQSILIGTESFLIFLPHISTQQIARQALTDTSVLEPAYQPTAEKPRLSIAPDTRAGDDNCYTLDFNCDTDINTADLAQIASIWNCTTGEDCFASVYDLNQDKTIDIIDLAWVRNEYDVTPPEMKILTPTSNQVFGDSQVNISGVVTDVHQIASVKANDTWLSIDGNRFAGSAVIPDGNQTLLIEAKDTVGKIVVTELVVGVDRSGPDITIIEPANRQSVYTLTPTVTISYNDFQGWVNIFSLQAMLTNEGGEQIDITNHLTWQTNGVSGVITQSLTADTNYTITARVEDQYGNESITESTFHVPLDVDNITPPTKSEGDGDVAGQVFVSSDCDDDLQGCAPLAGAKVTLLQVTNIGDLERLRDSRQEAAIAADGDLDPLPEDANDGFTTEIAGTIVTGPDGFFSFPVSTTGHYWVSVEKDGFTNGQREVDIVRHHSTSVHDVYLTPIDTAVTLCDTTGCNHESSDGRIKISIPEGAIADGEIFTTTATLFDQVEFLPAGEEPPGTWETYAFDLVGGPEDVTFTRPVTVEIANTLGFAPGTQIPLGYWNEKTLAWEHAGTAEVDQSGEWVVMQVTHFSKYDCNDPLATPEGAEPEGKDETEDNEDDDECGASVDKCLINLKTGQFSEEIELQSVQVLNRPETIELLYDTSTVMTNEVIDAKLSVSVGPDTTLGNYIGFELFIAGEAVDQFTFEANLEDGEIGRYRYLWDGKNALGEQLPSGIYEYQIRFSVPYRAQYCYALDGIFGNPPDCEFGATGRYLTGEEYIWIQGTVELNARHDSPVGAGWQIKQVQSLYENEAGEILIIDGLTKSEFYFPAKDYLLANNIVVTTGLRTADPLATPQDNRSSANRAPSGCAIEDTVGNSRNNTQTRANNNCNAICGGISVNTTWSVGSGDYLLTCDVTIASDTILTIEPGVSVKFDNSNTSLIVEGTLIADGTVQQQISFGPNVETTAGSWSQIRFEPNSTGLLDYTIVEYGGSNQGAVWISSNDVTVSNSIIQHSANSGIYIESAAPSITYNEIQQNSSSNYGGGILGLNGNPTIENNHIHNNTAFLGGGVYLENATNITLENNIFAENSVSGSDSQGGGLFLEQPTNVIVELNRFEQNITIGTHSDGGALVHTNTDPADLVVRNNHFEANEVQGSTGYGGAMRGHAIVSNNMFLNNQSPRGGGAIHGNFMTVENNIFEGNSSALGGALYMGGSTIVNNIFKQNSATTGGAIWASRNEGIILNNTIYDNQANSGSAIWFNYTDTPMLRNNIIVNNQGGRALDGYTPPENGLAYNNVWNNSGGNYDFTIPPLDLSVDPLFVDAVSGDFHLQNDSPMIDAGDPENYPDIDFDNEFRFAGSAPDIGADEYGNVYTPTSRTTADYSTLLWDSISNTYTRVYPDGTAVHFNTNGSHDYTLETSGKKTIYHYYSDGSVSRIEITAPNQSEPDWTWQFFYNNGQLSSILDPANRETLFELDRHNHLRTVTFPDRSSQLFAYDENGLMTQHTDEEGAVKTHVFDQYGRIRQATEPARIVFDPATGQNTTIRETLVFTPSDTAYPLINESILGTTAVPAPAVPVSADLQDKVDFGRGQTSGQTNQWGKWLSTTDPISRTTTREYDEQNNLTRDQLPDGDCVTYTYDSNGNRLTRQYFAADYCLGNARIMENSNSSQDWTYTYEPRFNQLKTETDPLGNVTTYIYDYEEGVGTAGNLIRTILPPVANEVGLVVTPTVAYTYNALNLLETETDARGSTTRYIYTTGSDDEASTGTSPLFQADSTPFPGLLTQVIQDDNGINLTTTYRDFDAAGNPRTIIMPGQVNTQTLTYDEMNRVLTITDAEGKVVKFAYDGRGNRLSQTVDYTEDGITGRNVVTQFSYDDDDTLLFESTDADGLVVQTRYFYDINRKLARQIDGRGHITNYIYDDADQLIQIIDPAGHTISRTYTLDGQLETEIDADGYTTRYHYDELRRLTSRTVDEGGLNQTTHYEYDTNNNITSMTDPIGVKTCYEYDSHNRQTAKTQDCGGLNLRTEYAYDLNSNLIYVTDERGIVTHTEYDALNRPTLTRLDDGGLNLSNRTYYDSAGNIDYTSDERGIITRFEYDNLNRLTQECGDSAGLNLCTNVTYDRLNNPQTVTDPKGITTQTHYNAFSQPLEEIADAAGLQARTSYHYDNALNLTRITDDNGNSTAYTYTERDELASESYADGTVVAYSYDGRGNRHVLTNQDGNTITETYDGSGRLQNKTFSTGGSQTFGYDLMNRMTLAQQTMHGHSSELTFAYDPLGSITQTIQTLDSVSHQVGYTYSYTMGQSSIIYPSNEQIVRTIDPLRRLKTVQRGDNSTIATYRYADLDSYYTLAYENGTTNRTEYDALRRITRVSSEVGDYRYGYDAAGNRIYMQRAHKDGAPADIYEYDGLYQLTQVWYGANGLTKDEMTTFDRQQFYELDTLGNRLTVTDNDVVEDYGPQENGQLSNPMNRYESVDGSPFSYDLRGNTLTDGRNSYTYNILNQQIGMINDEHTAEYVYDALGRRIAKIVDGEIIYFVYDNNYQVLEEINGDLELEASYVYGRGLDEPLIRKAQNTTHFYHRNTIRSITEITTLDGQLIERYQYDIYGSVQIFSSQNDLISGSSIQNPYQYTGRRFDMESHNWFLRFRLYSSELGRFLHADPAGFADSLNLYQYTRSNPIRFIDPMGLASIEVGASGKFTIYAGPTPIPGTGVEIIANVSTKAYQCCNEKGKKEWWGQLHVEVTAQVVFGGAFKNLELAPNSRGSKYRDRNSKRYAKGPKPGYEIEGASATAIDDIPHCPQYGCTGYVEGFIKGEAGAYFVGVKGSITFPLYPKFDKPEFDFASESGITGAKLEVGVKGSVTCNARLDTVFKMFN